jgi:hypothetical protein
MLDNALKSVVRTVRHGPTEEKDQTSYWMIVERYENWVVDFAEKFQRFGLSERKRSTANQIVKRDTVIEEEDRMNKTILAMLVDKPTALVECARTAAQSHTD